MIDNRDPHPPPPTPNTPQESGAPTGDPYRVRALAARARQRQTQTVTGRRTRHTDTARGHTVRATVPSQPIRQMSEVALAASLHAAAVRWSGGSTPPFPATLRSADLRRKVRAARVPNLILFVVDASGSMAARERMSAVKGAILSLLLDAYQKRDAVGLICFRGAGASLVLPPTNSVSRAHQHLAQLPTGGRTPLSSGLMLAHRLLAQHDQRASAALPLVVLLTDGRANVGQDGTPDRAVAESHRAAAQLAARGWSSLVIDCESGFPRLGLARPLAEALGGECVRLEALSAATVTRAVQRKLRAEREPAP